VQAACQPCARRQKETTCAITLAVRRRKQDMAPALPIPRRAAALHGSARRAPCSTSA